MLFWLFSQDNTLIIILLVEPFLFCQIINCPWKILSLPNHYRFQHQTCHSFDNGNYIYNNKKIVSKSLLYSTIKIPLHLPPPPQTFILIILLIHVQSLHVTFNAPQFLNHLTCRQLQPPKSNDPSITHYLTSLNHCSFFYHLHFNSKQIILSKQLAP